MDRRRRNLVVGLSGVAAATAAGALLLGDGDTPSPDTGSRRPSDPQHPDVRVHGAVGDGVADDTGAIQAAIDAVLGETGSLRAGRIVFPAGVYRITRTLIVTEAAAMFEAHGAALAWDGPPGTPMLRLDACSGTSVAGLRFVGKPGARPSAAISLRSVASRPDGCSHNTLSSISIGAVSGREASDREFETGILLEGDDVGGRANRFETISVSGCETGVSIARPQFVRNSFVSLRVAQCGTAFHSNAGISTSGTNWVLSGSTRADILLGNGARLRVKGFASRMGARLALTEQSSLAIRDGFWEMGPNMAPDGIVIDGRNDPGRSFLRLEDVDFTETGARTAARIAWRPESLVFMSNVVGLENRP
jgi:Pectate lyase superfamily protein